MSTVHLFTDLEHQELSASDQLLAEELRNRGLTVLAQPWETHNERIGIGLIRSTWNYAHNVEAFKMWLASSEELCKQLLNPLELIWWNLDKSYLLELSAAGVQTVPTHTPTADPEETWRACLDLYGNDLVAKPRIGNSGYGVTRVRTFTEFTEITNDKMIVQPFIPELATGEVSFIFFETTFSHAIRRIAKAGDFRANIAQGATVTLYEPTREEIEAVASIISYLPQTPHYCRIDGYFSTNQFILSEIELIEPGLFLREGARYKAAERFADFLLARI